MPWIRAFLYNISFKTWSLPDKDAYLTYLLDEAYENVQKVVDDILKALSLARERLHFILNESTDKRNRRIINLSTILKPFGSFFLINKDSKDTKLERLFFFN